MKRIFIILAIVLAVALVVGVALVAVSAYRDADFAALYNDEQAIRKGSGSTIRVSSFSSNADGTLTSRVKSASGIFGVWNCRDAQEVTFTIDLNVTSGRAKLVYCEDGRALLTLAESTGEAVNSTVTVTTSGRADVRLVCDNAAYTLNLEASAGTLTVP